MAGGGAATLLLSAGFSGPRACCASLTDKMIPLGAPGDSLVAVACQSRTHGPRVTFRSEGEL